MNTIVFVAPFLMPTTREMIRALARVPQTRVVAVLQTGNEAEAGVPVVLCPAVLDQEHLSRTLDAVIRRIGRPTRLIGILESLQEHLAYQRERLGLPGMRSEVVANFRDKDRMKSVLREAGVPVAASIRVGARTSAAEIAQLVGFPLILKPLDGAGAVATKRIQTMVGLQEALKTMGRPLIAETFLSGAEHSCEVFVRDGQPVFGSPTRYLPSALEVADNPYLQWVVHLPRNEDAFQEPYQVIKRAVVALGMQSGLAHVEWFRMPDGRICIGEIAARPPGAHFMELHGYAYATNWFDAWANLVVRDVFIGPWKRQWSVAGVYLRGAGNGRVVAVDGLDRAQATMGVHVVKAQLPKVGQPRKSGYEGEGFVVIRHRDDEVVRRAALSLIQTVRVRYA